MSSLADMWSYGATAADMRNRPVSGRTAPTTAGRARWMGPPGFEPGASRLLGPGALYEPYAGLAGTESQGALPS